MPAALVFAKSHPMRVRELKPKDTTLWQAVPESHPMRVRELKRLSVSLASSHNMVAPHAGA